MFGRTLRPEYQRINVPAQFKALFELLTNPNLAQTQNVVKPNMPTPTTQASSYQPPASPTPYPSMPTAPKAEGYVKKGRNPNSDKFSAPSSVVDAINQASQAYGVPPELLFDIAIQESGLNPTPQANPQSTAGGLFQYTNPTWETVMNYKNMEGSTLNLPNDDKLDPLTSALATAYLISKGQLGRWDASKSEGGNAWGNYYSDEELQPYYRQTLGRR